MATQSKCKQKKICLYTKIVPMTTSVLRKKQAITQVRQWENKCIGLIKWRCKVVKQKLNKLSVPLWCIISCIPHGEPCKNET